MKLFWTVALAESVQNLRFRRGLTQRGLAQKAGLGLGTIKNIENGTANPNPNTLYNLSRAFNVSFPDLLRDLYEQMRPRPDVQRIVSISQPDPRTIELRFSDSDLAVRVLSEKDIRLAPEGH